MFDVFYTGPKPNLFAFERSANDLEDAAKLSRTTFFWFIHGSADYTDFDFDWVCPPWEADHIHVFASQWQATGGVYFANKNYISERKYNFRTEQRVNRLSTQIFYMDFLNEGSTAQFEQLSAKWPNMKSTRYVDNHLDVLKRIMNSAETKFVWVISSICDYSEFDFTWHPEFWQEDMIHVFPSGMLDSISMQKRGDTFYINCESFKTQMVDLALLDWFNVINYCNDQTVKRFDAPRCIYEHDDLVSEVKKFDFKFPYAVFANSAVYPTETMCLWTEKDRSIEVFTRSHGVSVIPRDVKRYLKTQIYDYPYIKDTDTGFIPEKRLDIVYISNGEPCADHWSHHLLNCSRGSNFSRVMDVKGRANAYKAAARASNTPWFFAVFAKIEVDMSFDWTWQPDYLQEPKHYIFYARNPLNGLTYGHQSVIAYNKRLVLETEDIEGLDFTLSKPHEVVPIISGTAHFNSDPWTTWRTAFREVVKLKHYLSVHTSVETEYRLNVWLTKAEGNNAIWCLKGAKDAVEYYDSVKGNYSKLMLSFEWAWLTDYFNRVTKP